jgi:hypothetical protein
MLVQPQNLMSAGFIAMRDPFAMRRFERTRQLNRAQVGG